MEPQGQPVWIPAFAGMTAWGTVTSPALRHPGLEPGSRLSARLEEEAGPRITSGVTGGELAA
ncbi:hypothetical protein SR41_07090 [Sphingomonas melonis]|uniref:Uncharacterized protein n=1 Tax=Sphingomonas melonis TaxID=152682 RepID=A0A0D1K4X8_9SPHN|nr:hypothetical protein SR41_07090 [Sphingomonas melonis]